MESPPKRKKSLPRKSVSEPQNTRHPTPEESHKKRGNRKKEERREERRDETPAFVPDGQDQVGLVCCSASSDNNWFFLFSINCKLYNLSSQGRELTKIKIYKIEIKVR